jgi:hypothetical protein
MILFRIIVAVVADPDPGNEINGAVDVRKLAGQSEYGWGFPLLLMGTSMLGFLVFYAINIRRIIKELTAAAPLYDLADPETRMDYTIAERGVGGD